MRLRDIMTTDTVSVSPPSDMPGSARGAAGVPSKAGEAYRTGGADRHRPHTFA